MKPIKLVKESINESVKVGEKTYDAFKLEGTTRVLANKEGLLGNDGQLVPWDLVKELMKKFNIQ